MKKALISLTDVIDVVGRVSRKTRISMIAILIFTLVSTLMPLGLPVYAASSCGQQGNAISAGNAHTLLVKNDGTVWAWGMNAMGELGNGSTTYSSSPVQVQGLTGVIAVSAEGNGSLALKNDGTVWAWGDNEYGQLGDGTTTNRLTPVQVQGLTNIIEIAGGYYSGVALKNDGTVWTWGENNNGELGNGTTTNSSVPIQVPGLTGITKISAYQHVLALKNDGTIWAWGSNNQGQVGTGGTSTADVLSPVQVPNFTGVTSIAAGQQFSVAIKSDGTVWTWGEDQYGEYGDGTHGLTYRSTPGQVKNLAGVTNVAASDFHILVLKNDGTVWAWGYNGYGQLGNGTTTESDSPIQVSGLTGVSSLYDAGKGYFSGAVKSDGTAWAWGNNQDGELGNGTTTESTTPIQVVGITL